MKNYKRSFLKTNTKILDINETERRNHTIKSKYDMCSNESKRNIYYQTKWNIRNQYIEKHIWNTTHIITTKHTNKRTTEIIDETSNNDENEMNTISILIIRYADSEQIWANLGKSEKIGEQTHACKPSCRLLLRCGCFVLRYGRRDEISSDFPLAPPWGAGPKSGEKTSWRMRSQKQ